MVRVEAALTKLREIVTSDGRIDEAYCRRLLLRATSRMDDLERAAELSDRASLLIATLELSDALGSDRQYQVGLVTDALDEIEEATQSS